jgi:hypothetical protein
VFSAGVVAVARSALRSGDPTARVAAMAVCLGIAVVFLAAQTEGRFFNDPYTWLLIGALAALAARGRVGESADTIAADPIPARGPRVP